MAPAATVSKTAALAVAPAAPLTKTTALAVASVTRATSPARGGGYSKQDGYNCGSSGSSNKSRSGGEIFHYVASAYDFSDHYRIMRNRQRSVFLKIHFLISYPPRAPLALVAGLLPIPIFSHN